MIQLLVGPAGAGKRSLLQRLETYAARAGVRIKTGRAGADPAELESLLGRLKGSADPAFIVLEEGFRGAIPEGVRVTWIRRSGGVGSESDSWFASVAQETFTLQEGFTFGNEVERDFFLGNSPDGALSGLGGVLTLLPENFRGWEGFIERRLGWGIGLFELRDDLLDAEQVGRAVARLPRERILFSFRRKEGSPLTLDEVERQGFRWDWPLELGTPPAGRVLSVVSLHTRHEGESVTAAGDRLNALAPGAHLKLAVQVRDFAELRQGHEWRARDPGNRSFLPSSPDGRWSWYRLLMRNEQALNFLREGAGSSHDQPFLGDWARFGRKSPCRFAAVLGDPVAHSRTPAEHFAFFSARGIGVFAIRVSEAEWDAGALEVLTGFGLRYAAVTAPLKLKAWELARASCVELPRVASVNTLQWDDSGRVRRCGNTDVFGLQTLLAPWMERNLVFAAWGGGGTLEPLKLVAPQTLLFSARSGCLRDGNRPAEEFSPDVVIWGVGRSREGAIQWPPAAWRPQTVVDLNYSADSPGREYAARCGADYVSGLDMFLKQAEGQRLFWEK